MSTSRGDMIHILNASCRKQASRRGHPPDAPGRALALGLRWIARRTRPSRRQARNLTAFEKATGWRYSSIVTNIPAAGEIPGVPGSHHAQFTVCRSNIRLDG
jgi:hypothetical protein